MTKNIDNLVICSTLNQITNYIAIKNLQPKNIYNITFDPNIANELNFTITPSRWDENLKSVLNEKKLIDILINSDIYMDLYFDLEKFKEKLKNTIPPKTEAVYWNITGGQRIFSIAISELIKEEDRDKDVIFYFEGNSGKAVCLGKNKIKLDYLVNDLDFCTVFNLMGYETKDLDSTRVLKGKINKNNNDEENKNYSDEIKFYLELYKWITESNGRDEEFNLKFERTSFKGSFKKLLLESNSVKKFISSIEYNKKSDEDKKNITRIERQTFLLDLFEKLKERNLNLEKINYDFANSEEMKKEYPAGYIFEKLVGYKIYDVVKDNNKIVGMAMSLKIYKNTGGQSSDEIDIALLTNNGRLINFECKSGAMKGDNAKSHNFTTYSLSGVFGAPIFLTPKGLRENISPDLDKKLNSACNAAEKAKLKIIYLDNIVEIKKLI